MSKSKVIILAVITIFIVGFLWLNFGPKIVRGQVVEETTGNGIPGVTVRIWQRGWGFSGGSLIWDKDYFTTVLTNDQGRFILRYYRGGSSVHLQFSKDGYQSTEPGYPLQDTYIDFWEKPIVVLKEIR